MKRLTPPHGCSDAESGLGAKVGQVGSITLGAHTGHVWPVRGIYGKSRPPRPRGGLSALLARWLAPIACSTRTSAPADVRVDPWAYDRTRVPPQCHVPCGIVPDSLRDRIVDS